MFTDFSHVFEMTGK